jgi:acylphosphatase
MKWLSCQESRNSMNYMERDKSGQIKIRVHIIVKGRVQGVYFRQNAQRMCSKSGVTGWVLNMDDGSVEAILEGDKNSVENTISWFKVGPPSACVEKIELSYDRYTGEFQDFKIRY